MATASGCGGSLRVCSEPRWTRAAALALTLALAAAPSWAQETRDAAGFAAWREAHPAPVAAFQKFLEEAGVGQLVELHELLRSASDWQVCDDQPYALPPPEHWPAAVRVLQLLKELRAAGVLGRIEVHSTYRNPRLNACAGGAERSAHLRAYAIDFTPLEGDDPTDRLCSFWRERGPAWDMGLGRYRSGRIHVDTAGHRSWGTDPGGQSTACSANRP